MGLKQWGCLEIQICGSSDCEEMPLLCIQLLMARICAEQNVFLFFTAAALDPGAFWGSDVSTNVHSCSQLCGFIFTRIFLILQKNSNSNLNVYGTISVLKLLPCFSVVSRYNTYCKQQTVLLAFCLNWCDSLLQF